MGGARQWRANRRSAAGHSVAAAAGLSETTLHRPQADTGIISADSCGKIEIMTSYDVTKAAQADGAPPLITEEEQEDGVDLEREDESLPIGAPIQSEKISIATKSPTIDLIVSRIKEKEIDLEPDFQREQMWDNLPQESANRITLIAYSYTGFLCSSGMTKTVGK